MLAGLVSSKAPLSGLSDHLLVHLTCVLISSYKGLSSSPYFNLASKALSLNAVSFGGTGC